MELKIFEKIWNQYSSLTPHAKKIHDLLESRGEKIENDHVAYRSINLEGFGIDVLAAPFEDLGYKRSGTYHFEEKKLNAIHLEHEDSNQPKVFISELLTEEFSDFLQNYFKKIVEQIKLPEGEEVLTCGRLWDIDHKTYEKLYEESEYAAWFSAFGYCANHFTVFINSLKEFKEIKDLNDFLEKNNFQLNSSGGKIKGSPEVYLEQSSTLAGVKKLSFTDGNFEIPSCYYEFAKRYPLENGDLYQGFVEKSADKIFESTNKGV